MRPEPRAGPEDARVVLLLTPAPEFAELAGVVLASVFRLSALESVRHSPALFVCENRGSIFGLLVAVSGGSFCTLSRLRYKCNYNAFRLHENQP